MHWLLTFYLIGSVLVFVLGCIAVGMRGEEDTFDWAFLFAAVLFWPILLVGASWVGLGEFLKGIIDGYRQRRLDEEYNK